jgi:hypothetical protein
VPTIRQGWSDGSGCSEHLGSSGARPEVSASAAPVRHAVRPSGDIATYLKEVETRDPGLEQIMIGWALGAPPDLMLEQLTRFARAVIPAFSRQSFRSISGILPASLLPKEEPS